MIKQNKKYISIYYIRIAYQIKNLLRPENEPNTLKIH